jgi:AcrR family transcriptional regulator
MPKILSDADIETFREKLCDVAEGLFAAKGPDGVTLRELAVAMGVSSMTPYRYFKDKDAILAAVRTRAFNRFAAAMEDASAALRKQGGGQPGKAYLDFALSNRAAYRMMFDVSQPTVEQYPDLVAAMARARLTMSASLHELAQEGRFAGDVDLSAHIYWSQMHGAVMLELAGLLWPPMDAMAIATPALEMLAKELGFSREALSQPASPKRQ